MTTKTKALIGYQVLAFTLFMDLVATATLAIKVHGPMVFIFAVVTVFNTAFFLATAATIKQAKELK